MVSRLFEQVREATGARQLYDPTSSTIVDHQPEVRRAVMWPAFPRRDALLVGWEQALASLDDAIDWKAHETEKGTRFKLPYRGQSEYCEWRVTRNAGGKITRIVFTTESLEYWAMMAQGRLGAGLGGEASQVGPKGDLRGVLRRYRQYVDRRVSLADITFGDDVYTSVTDGIPEFVHRRGDYNPWNRWNTTDGLLHLSSRNNQLGALLDECAAATVGRTVDGVEVRDPTRALGALALKGGGGGINDFADNAINGVIGSLARAGDMITLADAPAWSMRQLDMKGWAPPEDAPRTALSHVWTGLRGRPGGWLLAKLEVPPRYGFTVGDITIFGQPIEHGGQVARCLTVGFDVTATSLGQVARRPLPAASQAMRLRSGEPWLRSAEKVDAADASTRFAPAFPTAGPSGVLEPLLRDREIQGNALAGFNKSFQWFIGFNILPGAGATAKAKRWLAEEVAGQIASTAKVAAHNARWRAAKAAGEQLPTASWLNVAFSFKGLERLGADTTFESAAFRAGIAGRNLFEVAPEPDILLILAADNPAALARFFGPLAVIATKARSWGLEAVSYPPGENVGNGAEHFGFKDGVSQPGVRGRLRAKDHPPITPRAPDRDDPNGPEYSAPGETLVWPGEFVLGWPRQDLRHPRQSAPPWPHTRFSRDGTFLVFLQFQQDVAAFKALVAREAARQRIPRDLAAARLVGRWPSGSPLVDHPREDGGLSTNAFSYADPAHPGEGSDPRGLRCPFGAHIRKANPRDDATEEGALPATLRRRILRRGISYGPLYARAPRDKERGLLFVAYQASIEEQFEFLWSSWLLDPFRPVGPTAVDRLVSPQIARVLAGGYFFSPAISAVKALAR